MNLPHVLLSLAGLLPLLLPTPLGTSASAGSANASAIGHSVPVLPCAGNIQITYLSDSVCNCTTGPGTMQICESTTAEVSVGNTVVTASTGGTSTNCFSQTVQPGQCLGWRYVFDCCRTPGLFGTFRCTAARPPSAVSSTTTCPSN